MDNNSSLSSAQLTFAALMVAQCTEAFRHTEMLLLAEADTRQSCIDYEELDHELTQLGYQIEYINEVW